MAREDDGKAVTTFEQAVALFAANREPLKHTQLMHEVRPVSFAPGMIEIRITGNVPRDFCPQIASCLTQWTGQPWKVVQSEEQGNPSLHEMEITRKEKQVESASAHPLVSSVFEQFPGAKLVGVN